MDTKIKEGTTPFTPISHCAMPVFSGGSPNNWLYTIKRIYQYRKRKNLQSDAHFLDEVLCCVHGEPAEWVLANEKDFTTVENFLELFTIAFKEDTDLSHIKVKFCNVRQGNRPVLEYAEEFETLWRTLTPQYCSESLAILKFATGLTPSLYTPCIPEITCAESLQSFIAMVICLEADLVAGKLLRTFSSQNPERAKRHRGRKCFSCGQQGHLARNCIEGQEKKPEPIASVGKKDTMLLPVKDVSRKKVACRHTTTTKPTYTKHKPLLIDIKIGNRVISAMLSTCSEFNFITSTVVDELQEQLEVKSLKEDIHISLAVTGHTSVIKEYIEIPFFLPSIKLQEMKPMIFYIAVLGKYEAILGEPFINRYNLTIQSFKHLVTMENVEQNLLKLEVF